MRNNNIFSNLFYFYKINNIGGIESWYYYIANSFSTFDITLVYNEGDPIQIARLSRKIRCIKWDGTRRFSCKKLFINFNTNILDYVEAESIAFFIHGDYKNMIKLNQISLSEVLKISNDKRIKEYYAVSDLAAKSFNELTGIKAKVCYNPIQKPKQKKFIRLCSAQRMTPEKGEKRINKLIEHLELYCKLNNVAYQWDIYTNSSKYSPSPNVVYREQRLDIKDLLYTYDYFVALSDNEGYCYSVVEALMQNVPCIITPCPVFSELGLDESNSIRLNFDCSNLAEVVDLMFDKTFNFTFEPPKTLLGDLLVKDKTSYVGLITGDILVECIRGYYDLELNRTINIKEVFYVNIERAKYLLDKKLIKIVEGISL